MEFEEHRIGAWSDVQIIAIGTTYSVVVGCFYNNNKLSLGPPAGCTQSNGKSEDSHAHIFL